MAYTPYIVVIGTEPIAAAQLTADSAYALAQIGTNTGTAALDAAASAQSSANSAFSVAVIGTNAAAAAQSSADAALAAASIAQSTVNLETENRIAADAAEAASRSASDQQIITIVETGTNVANAAWALAQAGTIPSHLTELQDVNVPSPQAQQVLLFNGSIWIAGDSANVASPGAFNFYLEDPASGTNDYLTLATEPSGIPEGQITVAVGGIPALIPVKSFISLTADRDHLNAGIWRFAVYASVGTQNRTAYAICEMWVRGIDGAESFLFSGTSEPINSATPTLYMTVISRGSYAVARTDKLVAKYYFKRADNPTTTATLYFAGTDNISLIATPIVLEHNDLDGIQGGVTSERYHVIEAVSDALNGANAPSVSNVYITASALAPTTAIAVAGTNAAASAQSTANAAYALAQIGTNQGSGSVAPAGDSALASAAWTLAQIGTNTGTAALNAAATAQSIANSAFSIAVAGTNAAATAQSTAASAQSTATTAQSTANTAQITANTAQARADSAFSVAVIGTNAAATAQSTANSGLSVASIGTNTGSTAYSVAQSAFSVAVIGTNSAATAQSTGNAAFTIAVAGTNAAASAQSTANSALSLAQSHVAKALAVQHDNATTTPTIVSGLSVPVGVGTVIFRYYLIYQSSAATTGIKFDLNCTGTVTRFVWNQRWVDISATAATAAADQDEVLATGAVMGAFASRAKGTAGRGTTLSVDTLNADMLMIIEGIAVVSGAGSLDLYHGSETANTTSLMVGSSVLVTPTI